jgi:hypothetical protein
VCADYLAGGGGDDDDDGGDSERLELLQEQYLFTCQCKLHMQPAE